MECPYCNSELNHEDSYGNKNYIIYGNQQGKAGDIFRCPNHEGFEDDDEALKYLKSEEKTLEELGIDSLEELCCESSLHHVSGSFYTDRNQNLHNGYPC